MTKMVGEDRKGLVSVERIYIMLEAQLQFTYTVFVYANAF
jgi:hypothetical protein